MLGQPNLNFTVDRDQAARYGINVSDVQDAIQTAVGGNALTQVLMGEQRYDLVLRYLPQYRDTKEAIEKIRLLAPSGERVSLAQLTKIKVTDGGSEIYREGELALCRGQIQRARPRPGQHGRRSHQESQRVSETAARATPSTGRASTRARSVRDAASAGGSAAHHPADLHHPLHHVQLAEVGAADPHQRGHGAASAACWRC